MYMAGSSTCVLIPSCQKKRNIEQVSHPIHQLNMTLFIFLRISDQKRIL